MKKLKINSSVVYLPPDIFPDDNLRIGKIVSRKISDKNVPGLSSFRLTEYQISWENGDTYTYDGYSLSGPQFNFFPNQKEALAFILKNS